MEIESVMMQYWDISLKILKPSLRTCTVVFDTSVLRRRMQHRKKDTTHSVSFPSVLLIACLLACLLVCACLLACLLGMLVVTTG
jgi:hypothetical protein